MSTVDNVECPVCGVRVCFLGIEDYAHAKCEGPEHHEFEILDIYQSIMGGEVKLRAVSSYPGSFEGEVFMIELDPLQTEPEIEEDAEEITPRL